VRSGPNCSGSKTKGRLFLFSVICYLTPETYLFLTPKIKRININKLNPCFVNYLWDTTLGDSVKLSIIRSITGVFAPMKIFTYHRSGYKSIRRLVEAISKMSFGPISLLVPRFKSFDPPQADLRFMTHKAYKSRWGIPQRGTTHKDYWIGGKSSNAGKLGPAAILNQNPIFETASMDKFYSLKAAAPAFQVPDHSGR
jgi:hypothetical protein